MSEYALVENGICTNAIIADADFIATQPGTWVDITTEAGVGIGWTWDGTTWTAPEVVIVSPTEAELQQRAEATAAKVQLQVTMKVQLDADTLFDEDYADIVYLYSAWSGESVLYKVDAVVRDAGILYKVVQEHVSQPSWNPAAVPALFTPYRLPLAAWVQPTGAQDDYAIGDRVTHDNPNDGGTIWVYESTLDGNTTEPGRDGTFDRYWTPISVVV